MTQLLLDTHLLLKWLNVDPLLPHEVVARVQAVGDLESDEVHRDTVDRLLVCQLQRYGATVIVI